MGDHLVASGIYGDSLLFIARPGFILKAPVSVLEDEAIRESESVLENSHVERHI